MNHTDAIRALDRLQREQDILAQMRETPVTDESAAVHYDLMAQQAKRVRSTSNLVVRALARLRDQLQPKEGTSE